MIKICGIAKLQEAETAAATGASALGIMQVRASTRYLPLDTACQLRDSIKASPVCQDLAVVVVVADPDTAELEEILASLQPDFIQFHGAEEESFCAKFGRPYIKAISATGKEDILRQAAQWTSATYLLLDTPLDDSGSLGGGSGKVFDWEQIPPELADKLIIAGGLTPENVGELLHKIKVHGVDVSSGVESSPGKKDLEKIKNFVTAAKTALR